MYVPLFVINRLLKSSWPPLFSPRKLTLCRESEYKFTMNCNGLPCMIAAGQCVLNWAKNLQSVPSSMTTAIASAQLTLWQTGSHRESYNSFWNNPAFSIAWCPSNPTQWETFWGRGSKKIIIFLKKMSLVIWVGFKGMCLSLKNYNLLTPSASKGSPLSTFIKFSDLISSYTIITSYSTASYFQTLHSVLCCHALFRFLFILCFILFLRG